MNVLGYGFHEKSYENALVVELGLRGIPWQQQQRYDVVYKDVAEAGVSAAAAAHLANLALRRGDVVTWPGNENRKLGD